MKKIVWLFIFILSCLTVTSWQYLYFTWNWQNNSWFQQWCEETYDINYNFLSESWSIAKELSVNAFVIIDTWRIAYVDSSWWSNWDKTANGRTFTLWSNWKFYKPEYPFLSGNILKISLLNTLAPISGIWKYWTLRFKPKYDSSDYDAYFWFYLPWDQAWTYIGSNNYFTSSKTWDFIHVVKAPCISDWDEPKITLNNNINGAAYTSGQTYKINSWLRVVLKDDWWTKTRTDVPYVWKTVNNTDTWTWNCNTTNCEISNQYWIDINTVSVVVSWVYLGNQAKKITLNSGNGFSSGWSNKTWENKDRDVTLSTWLNGYIFEVEEPVVISISVKDRTWVNKSTQNTSWLTITINKPKKPEATFIVPVSWTWSVPQSANIQFRVEDEWAGVKLSTVEVVLSGVNDVATWSYTFLNLNGECTIETWCDTLGSGWWYLFTFNPKALWSLLPNLWEFDILVTACDLKNNCINNQKIGSFKISPPCGELQCCGDVDMYVNHNWQYVLSWLVTTWSLTVSWWGNVRVDIRNIEDLEELSGFNLPENFIYTWWIAVIDCGVWIPTFTIMKWLPKNSEEWIVNNGEWDDENWDDENWSDGWNNDEWNDDQWTDDQWTDSDDVNIIATGVTTTWLYLSWNYETTKAIISGNIITLAHYIDTLDVEFTSPKSNLWDDIFVTNDTSTWVHFEWEYEYGSEKKWWNWSWDRFEIAWFDFKLWLIDSKWWRGDNGWESWDIQSHSLSTFDISGIYSWDLGDLWDPLVERYLPCGGVDPCTGLDLDALPDGLYTYAVVASDLWSNTWWLVSREIIDPETIDINEELSDSGDNVAQWVLVSNWLVPSINMINPKDWSIQIVGEVNFEWTVDKEQYCQWLFGPWISGFQYEIKKWDEVISSGFTTDRNLKLELSEWTYNMSMFIVYNGEFKWSLTWSLMEETFTVTKRSSGGGGWWNRIPRDDCPDWDYSDSYYDGLCEWATHGSAVYQCRIDESRYSDELKLAYLYSYINHVTTMCPIEQANLDGYLYRDHFAKMISAYAIWVLWRTPDTTKPWCDQFDDIADDTVELKNYIKLACQLNLMWMESDWQTVKKSFDPHSILTRAEFGTVFSRLLFGDKYNVKDESAVYQDPGFWYKWHLQALKEYGVMTQIDGTWPAYKEKRWRVMLMLMRADHYGLFEWFSPALNGIDALFAKQWTNNVF